MDIDVEDIRVLASIGAFLLLTLVRQLVVRIIAKKMISANIGVARKQITVKMVNIIYIIIMIIAVVGIWGLEGAQVFTYLTSILTVLGVAFFAQWSLLSNITAGIIMFFSHPLRLGQNVTIVEGDKPIEGIIENITFFFIHIRHNDGTIFTISNTIFIQKTIKINDYTSEFDKIERDLIGDNDR